MFKKIIAIALLALPVPNAFSATSDGFTSVFQAFFGTEDERNNSAGCGTRGSSGLLGQVNEIFCHLENDMGIKTTGSATKSFGTTTVHCDVTATSGTYANSASCWACTGASCSSTSGFSRLMNIQWTYSKGGTNKGTMIMDNGAFGGTAGSNAENFTWNVGSDVSTKTITAKSIFGSNKMNVSSSKTGSVLTANLVFSSFAFAVATDTSANNSLVNFVSGGTQSCTAGTNSGTPGDVSTSSVSACSQCFTRVKSGSDFTYTAASASTCSSLSLAVYPDTMSNVGAYTVTSVVNGWNSMATNPSAL